jgi:3-methyladenine DNA glycosylase AlkD
MRVREIARGIRLRLEAEAEPAFRDGVQSFFKEPVDPWGVRAPAVHKIAREAWQEVKTLPVRERDRLMDDLWRSGKLEEGSIAILLYGRLRKGCGAREFGLFERWIDRYVRNWAHCDGVASWLLAACVGNEPSLIERLPAWTRSRNRWKRRAAAVALIQEAKQGRSTVTILDQAERLLEDGDDMVRNGVGWLLKEAYPKKPREVMAFLVPRTARASRLLLRYAAATMSGADRASLLGLK